MSYKISELPSPRAYKEEHADFWEVEAIRNPGLFISQTNISKTLSVGLDEIDHSGIMSEDDEVDENLNEVFQELSKRPINSNGNYPFTFSRYSIKLDEEDSTMKTLYIYLLLCTRLSMDTQKIQNALDGTLIFEELCTYVAQKFFGAKSQAIAFGTSSGGSFEEKTTDLISRIGEGQSFKNPNNNSPTAKDDAVDVVVWIDFADGKVGKLIAFGQCKTGTTTWRTGIRKLNPENFCKKWFREAPVLSPIPLAFLTDTMNEQHDFYGSQLDYLVFNRFRILEYLDDGIDPDLFAKINTWVQGALNLLNINN